MRIFWLIVGLAATGCGIAGVVLPLVPTTPFLLVAAFAFARSSPALHNWLLSHPRLGPLIDHWHTHGAISRRTKALAVAVMVAMLFASWIAGLQTSLLLVQAGVLTVAALFILSRPDVPNQDN